MTAFLEVRNLTQVFGSLRAVNNANFTIKEGELVGLIGPNGAGKSTLYNLVAGAIKPTAGAIVLNGVDVTGWKPYQAARSGVARTFQIPKPYRNLNVIDNVVLSALMHHRSVADARAAAEKILIDFGLSDYRESPISVLTVGLLKRLEVARAVALQPKLVLFDEIMAGLSPAEVRGMTNLVSSLPARGITVIWVEHVLYAIMNAVRRIMVMHRGEMIADGTPEKVAKDPTVIKAYFGEEITLA
jgi:branched-chain amino acid transport system ATP-binding protein